MSCVLKAHPLGVQQPGYNADTPQYKLHSLRTHGGVHPFPTRRNGAVVSQPQDQHLSPSSCVTQHNFLWQFWGILRHLRRQFNARMLLVASKHFIDSWRDQSIYSGTCPTAVSLCASVSGRGRHYFTFSAAYGLSLAAKFCRHVVGFCIMDSTHRVE